MGIFAGLGVSVSVREPINQGIGFRETLTDRVSSWTHSKAANGGDVSASCSIVGDVDYINEWIENGLGRWITLYDAGSIVCFCGFVNSLSAVIGGVTITRGELLSIANRVRLVYSTVDTSTTPPTMGGRSTTPVYNDLQSQQDYGIVEKVLSSGGISAANAAQVAQMYLSEHAQPETAKTISLGAGSISLTLNIKGAWFWLGVFVANFTTVGTVNLSSRLSQILALDPNGIFTATEITANTLQVTGYRNDDKPALPYVISLLPLGDAAYNRYIAGCEGERVFYYRQTPSIIEYIYSISDMEQELKLPSGTIVYPWQVQSGKWVMISDALIGYAPVGDFQTDPRNILIEQLTYTAPFGLQVNGAKVSTLAQKLGQLGLSGIGG